VMSHHEPNHAMHPTHALRALVADRRR
jgi:hypothetical protein